MNARWLSALASNCRVLEILTIEADTTWSIIVITPNGVSCMEANGERWEPTNPQASNAYPSRTRTRL